MATERSIGPVAQIPPGEGRTFELDGLRITVFHTRAGEVFAVQPNCPHRNGPLADGLLGTATIICPLHERSYDLRTGAGIGNDDCLTTFPTHLDPAGMVLVTV